MSFNPEPSKQAVEILFTQEKNSIIHPPLYFNDNIVLRKNTHKHLGITLDSKLTFTDHIIEKIKVTNKHIGILRYLSKYLPLSTLTQMYKMFVRPHLDYGDVIYHVPHTINLFDSTISLHPLMERIEKMQYHAALAITGCWKGSNRNSLYEELGWESLSDRRWSRRLIQLYKIRNNMTPSYLKDKLPLFRGRSLRRDNDTNLQEIMCTTAKYQNSFFPDVIKSWNNIGNEFCSSLSLGIFKTNLFNLVRPKQRPVYGIHDPIGVKLLFQLRVGLSPLKVHKKRHNFTDTPNDWCDCLCAPEDTFHYLLSCNHHDTVRLNLRDSVMRILVPKNLHSLSQNLELYLYGHSSLSFIENKTILLATIKFIKESERFS